MIDTAARLRGAGLRVTRTRLELLGLLDDPERPRALEEAVGRRCEASPCEEEDNRAERSSTV